MFSLCDPLREARHGGGNIGVSDRRGCRWYAARGSGKKAEKPVPSVETGGVKRSRVLPVVLSKKEKQNMKRSLRIVLGCVVCSSLFMSVVRADSISGPFTTSTPIPSTLTDWSNTLSFPKFNSALGTLDKVQLDLSGGFTTTLTITNESDSASNGTAKTEVQLSVQDAGLNLSTPQLDLLSSPFSYSLGAGGSVSSGLLTQTGTSSDQYTLSAILAEFNGPGTISLAASTFTQTDLSNTGGNTAASQVTNASLTGSVTYYYAAVPEPSTFALLGAGAIGLLGIAWRRRRALVFGWRIEANQ